MSGILKKFNKDLIGSNDTLVDYTNEISPSGDFKKITGIDVIINSWKNLLRIRRRTKDHDPETSSYIEDFLFEPFDEDTRQQIGEAIRDILTQFDNRAKIESIDVDFLKNEKGFVVDIVASYKGEKAGLKVNVFK
jgi:phage baseplate assembly protein W